MAITIAFANQKGGVGKSTLSVQFALHACAVEKKRVLFIDLDAQGNSTTNLSYGNYVEALEKANGEPFDYEELFKGKTLAKDLFSDSLETIDTLETKTGLELIGTIKNCQEMADLEQADHQWALVPNHWINAIKDNYDIIVIDTPPALGTKLRAGLIMADYIVSPVKLSNSAFDGLTGLFGTIADVQAEANPTLKSLGYVVNDFDRSGNQRATMEFAREQYPTLIFNTVVCHRPPIDQATNQGAPVYEAMNSKAASNEISAFYKEVFERMENPPEF